MDTPSTSYAERPNTIDTPSTSNGTRPSTMDTPSTSYATWSKKKDTSSTSNSTRSKKMEFQSTRRVSTRLSLSADQLLELEEHDAAARIAADCLTVTKQQKQKDCKPDVLVRSKLLDNVLDKLLNPFEMIDDLENINWLRWLMASGKTLKEFDCAVKGYNTSKCCGFVWTEDYLAYSCHSCKISYNAALCIDCFKRGDHFDHDTYMFRSQGIGICNCGNPKEMKPKAFCPKHSAEQQSDEDSGGNNKQSISDVLRVTEKIMPRLLLRLVQYLRISRTAPKNQTDVLPQDLAPFLNMIYTLSQLGTAIRHVMTVSFINENVYQWACNYFNSIEHASRLQLIAEQKSDNEDEDSDNHSNNETCPINNGVALNNLGYSSFMDEIVYWTIKYEFSHKLIILLIHMLPDEEFRKALMISFSVHYKHVPYLMETTKVLKSVDYNSIRLSAELFSYEDSTLQIATNLDMFTVILTGLRDMMKNTLIPCTLHNWINRTHRVVNLSNYILSEHRYWSMTNNLNLMLTSKPIVSHFIQDDYLMNLWFSYLSMFQGMNTVVKEMDDHVEYDSTKLAGFSTEFKITACTLRTILLFLKSTDTRSLTICILNACFNTLRQWLLNIGSIPNPDANSPDSDSSSTDPDIDERLHDRNKISLHLPLHRFLAGLLNHTVRAQGIRIEDILPHCSSSRNRDGLLLAISTHPLRTQAAFYEIVQDAWVRNGQNIKRKAMLYVYPDYCTYLMDSDIYLLQVCLSEISNSNKFMGLILKTFNAYDWMNNMFCGQPSHGSENYKDLNIENIFVFLATLVGVRTNLCSDIAKDYCQIKLEIVTVLCLSNATHSQIMERIPNNAYIPKTCTNPYIESAVPDFDTMLLSVADFKKPCIDASEMLHDGFYVPSAETWKNFYDPVHVLLRSDSNRRTFQSSMDRYTDYMRSIGLEKQNKILWPPYRTPHQHHLAYNDPRKVLLTKLFHTLTWQCLYKSVVHENINERILSLVIHLLNQAWIYYTSSDVNVNAFTSKLPQSPMNIDSSGPSSESHKDCKTNTEAKDYVCPKKLIKVPSIAKHNNQGWALLFDGWFDHDDLVQNLCTTISIVESETRSSSSIATTHDIETETNNSQTNHPLAPINESIISLLLKLHSNLSGRPDSYQQPERSTEQSTEKSTKQSTEQCATGLNDQCQEETQTSDCGDGIHYISRLLDKMTKMSTLCYECVSRTRLELWPEVEINPIAQEEEDSKRRKRKLALMEEMAESQRAFLENAQNLEELDSTDKPSQSTNNTECMPSTSTSTNNVATTVALNSSTVNTANNSNKKLKKSADLTSAQQTKSNTIADCAICRKPMTKTTQHQNQRPLGLVIFIQNTNMLAHRRHTLIQERTTSPVEDTNDEENSCDDQDTEEKNDGHPPMLGQTKHTTYKWHDRQRNILFDQYFSNIDKISFNIGAVPTTPGKFLINGNVHVQTCGHYLHLKCLTVYINKLPVIHPARYKFMCPVCRQYANSVMPFIPAAENSINPHCGTTLNTNIKITVLTDAVNKLSELIETVTEYQNSAPSHTQTESSDDNVKVYNINGKTYDNSLIKSLNLCVRQMIEHNTPALPPTQQIIRFNNYWQGIIAVAWTNIHIKLVQLDNSVMKQQHKNDSSVTSPIIGDTSDSCNVNNKLSKYNCLGPLLKALHLNAQFLLTKIPQIRKKHLTNIWYELIGRNPSKFHDPPLLLRDPCDVLLQLIFLFPTLHPDLFDTLVAQIFNMQVYIAALKIVTIIDFRESSRTDLFNFPPHLPPIKPKKFKYDPLALQQTSLSFTNIIALTGNILYKSQNDGNVKIDKKNTIKRADNERMAEFYGRQSVLPFLRFAAFLKKHLYEDDIEDEHDDGSQTESSSSEPDSQTQPSRRRSVRINVENSTSSATTPGHPQNQQPRNYRWSEDDYEYLKLARYLNLLTGKHDRWPVNENNAGSSRDHDNGVRCDNTLQVKPPSVMESVFWPKLPYPEGTEGDQVSTAATYHYWLVSLRQALIIQIEDKDTNLVDLPAAARLLLGIDCCNGGRTERNRIDSISPATFTWKGPRLLELPTMYIDLFQIYYNRKCDVCKTPPKVPNLCLVCGALLCSQSRCCEKDNVFEVVQHSINCGCGTGVFLDLNTCTVMLFRDKFFTHWGSPYLDEYGEEDFNLERGMPLRLNNDRYSLLERQWITHRIDSVKMQWTPHFGKY